MKYNFYFILDQNKLDEEVENALFESGCDDATLSLNYKNLIIRFCRESTSLNEAMIYASEQVEKAGFKIVECQEEEEEKISFFYFSLAYFFFFCFLCIFKIILNTLIK